MHRDGSDRAKRRYVDRSLKSLEVQANGPSQLRCPSSKMQHCELPLYTHLNRQHYMTQESWMSSGRRTRYDLRQAQRASNHPVQLFLDGLDATETDRSHSLIFYLATRPHPALSPGVIMLPAELGSSRGDVPARAGVVVCVGVRAAFAVRGARRPSRPILLRCMALRVLRLIRTTSPAFGVKCFQQ